LLENVQSGGLQRVDVGSRFMQHRFGGDQNDKHGTGQANKE